MTSLERKDHTNAQDHAAISVWEPEATPKRTLTIESAFFDRSITRKCPYGLEQQRGLEARHAHKSLCHRFVQRGKGRLRVAGDTQDLGLLESDLAIAISCNATLVLE